MSVTPSSSLSSSTPSLFWTSPDNRPGSSYTLYNFPGFTLHSDGPPSEADDRRYHVFGTPISRCGTPAGSTGTAGSAYSDVGMDKLRGANGGGLHSQSSRDRLAELWPILRGGNQQEKEQSLPIARGGHGDTAWVLLDQPDTVVPDIPRRGSRQTESSMIATDGTNSEPPEGAITPPSRRLSQHSREQARRGSVESKFQENLPKPRKGSNPVHWIRKRVKSISVDTRQTEAIFPKEKCKEKGPLIPRRLKKRWSSVSILAEASEPPSNVPSSELKTAEHNPNSPPFLTLLDTALHTTPPRDASRLRRISTELNSLVPPGLRRSRPSSLDFPPLPPRPSSAPPRNSLWNLEFLPSEATGIKTPREYPVYDPKRLGNQPLPRKREAEYFQHADMVQSQPPLAPANEHPTSLGPTDRSLPSGPTVMHAFSSETCRAIAPFLQQDMECDRPSSPVKAALEATGQRIRRASLHARSLILPRKLSDVAETPDTTPATPPPPPPPPSRIRSPKLTLNFFKRTSTQQHDIRRRGQEDIAILPPSPPPPTEVLIERQKREKRDSGVIGLDPLEYEESTDDSFSYSSVMRDIAGLEKFPKGPASLRAREREQRELKVGTGMNVGSLATPPPPG